MISRKRYKVISIELVEQVALAEATARQQYRIAENDKLLQVVETSSRYEIDLCGYECDSIQSANDCMMENESLSMMMDLSSVVHEQSCLLTPDPVQDPVKSEAPVSDTSSLPNAPSKQEQGRIDQEFSSAPAADVDYTRIPAEMEKKFEQLDEDSALRPTIITPGTSWTKKYQKTLLSTPESKTLGTEEQGVERSKAFDLLDALTKSGALSVDYASLHVVIAATHCFDKTLMNTVIQDNVNPIEKVERSSLIVASTIQNKRPAELIAREQLERVATYSPMLIESAHGQSASEQLRFISETPQLIHS